MAIVIKGQKISDQEFDGETRTFHLWIPIRTKTGLNSREHWAVRAKRVQRERKATRWFWKIHDMWMLEGYRGPIIVTLVRVSPATRQPDGDNAVGGLKGVRDQIASQLGRDDGDRTITWVYDTRKGAWGIDVFIEVPKGGSDATESG